MSPTLPFSLPSFSFSNVCRFYGGMDFILGVGILWNTHAVAKLMHNEETADKLFSGNSEDKVAIRVGESLVGLLLVDIGILLNVMATSTSKEFQKLTYQAALVTHGLMLGWRFLYQTQLEAVRKEIPSQAFSDLVMSSTWAILLWKLLND